MMNFLPWKRKKDDEEPELDALLQDGPAVSDLTFDDDGDRSSEEEDLLNQYLNSDNESDGIEMPSAGPSAALSSDTPSGGSDDDDNDSVGFQFPDDDEDEDEENGGDEDDDLADDVMSIFEEDEEVDEDLASLTQGLADIDAAELLAEARSVARRLAAMTTEE